MSRRKELLNIITKQIILKQQFGNCFIVAIDGYDGAGKTVFANALAQNLKHKNVRVVRSSVDYFHHPKQIRYKKGRHSPVGYYEDSFNYMKLKSLLLEPLKNSKPTYITHYFNLKKDQIQPSAPEPCLENSVLVFDGIFLHRPELVDYWDYSIFLKVSRAETLRRCFIRDKSGSPSITAETNQRYVKGQSIYFQKIKPFKKANTVINNEDWDKPFIEVDAGFKPGNS